MAVFQAGGGKWRGAQDVKQVTGLIGGAGVGLALGGPLGALVGGLAGYAIDFLLAPAPRPAAFSIALIALCAKMAKADGVVVPVEVAAFRQVFDIPPEDLAGVARVFDLARQDTAGFESYAKQIGALFADEPETREDLLDALFHVAKADHALHPDELIFLQKVGALLGFEGTAYDRIEARHVRRPGDPYAVLDLPPDATDAQIKARWRILVGEHHPDRLLSRGLPPVAIKLANDRVAAVNAAYARIQALRTAG